VTAARLRRTTVVVREVLIVGVAVFLYFLVRGLVDAKRDLAFDHAERVIDAEQTWGVFVEPELQSAVLRHGWLVDVSNWVYVYGHWPVVVLTLVWVLTRHPSEFTRFRNAMLISGAIGLVIFVYFPVAPPRFMTQYGFIDTVTEQTNGYRVLQPPAFTNQYAAMPSLHFGWNLLMGIAWASLSGNRWTRLFGWLMPPLMFAAIVLTANHYLLDGVAGGALAMLGFVVATQLWATRRSSSPRPTRLPPPSPALPGRAGEGSAP
jgi:lipoprotein signal peptidase